MKQATLRKIGDICRKLQDISMQSDVIFSHREAISFQTLVRPVFQNFLLL